MYVAAHKELQILIRYFSSQQALVLNINTHTHIYIYICILYVALVSCHVLDN